MVYCEGHVTFDSSCVISSFINDFIYKANTNIPIALNMFINYTALLELLSCGLIFGMLKPKKFIHFYG